MKKRSLLILFLFCGLFTSQAQKVTGVYKGFMEVDSPKNTINFELTLKEKKGKLTGYCYRLFVLGDTLYYNLLKVNARISNDVLIVEDEYSVSNNFESNTRGIKTVFFFNLKDIRDTSTVLPGKWNTSAWRNYKSLTGVVSVIREKDYLSTQLYKRLADKNLDQDMAFEEPAVDKPILVTQNEQPKVVEKQNPVISEKDVRMTDKKGEENKTVKTDKEKDKNTTAVAGEEKELKEKSVVNKEMDRNDKTANIANPPKNKPAVAVEKTPATTVIDNNALTTDKKGIASNKEDSLSVQQKELIMAQNSDTVKRDYTDVKETIAQANIQTKELKRASDLIQTLSVFEDSITVALYDNGEIDGDTVSVYVNEKLLLNKVGLGAKAQKFTIYVPVGRAVQVSLFAETLGTIPPNTGLMVVYSGEQRYQVFFTSTLEKSASVLFRRL